MPSNRNIAIDGPAGAGKSTVARLVAGELNYLYIDSGAMYRAIAWKALVNKMDLGDYQALATMALNTDIELRQGKNTTEPLIFCDGKDITLAIRSPEVTKAVSQVAQIPKVREILVKQQRELAKSGKVVMDGRDIGSKVLPDAHFKFFLTASLQARAERRYVEQQGQGFSTGLAQIRQEILERDLKDSARLISPLVKVEDAIELDTSNYTAEQIAAKIVSLVKREI